MDILTLGKMNQMAKNTNSALELMANHVYEQLQTNTNIMDGQQATLDGTVVAGQATLQGIIDAGIQSEPQKHFFIYNSNHWTVTNGGCNYAWTVPTGTQLITFEILSGGGPGGSSGHDYDSGHGGAGGNYNEKTLCLEAGHFNSTSGSESVYQLCSGGTSMCSCCANCNRNCRHGCSSYVTGDGLSNFCAIGGHGGSTSWDKNSNCYNCHIGNQQCDLGSYNGGWVSHNCNEATHGGDMCFRGISGSHTKQYDCCSDTNSFAGGPSGPFATSGTSVNKHWCTGNMACCNAHAAFPGGGGSGYGSGSGSACWGSFGAGGLVKATYQ